MNKHNVIISTDKEQTQFKIYLMTSPSNKQYIGLTSLNIKNRIKQHVYDSENQIGNRPICRTIKKYGIDNIKIEIIDYANSKEEMVELEIYYIENYNTYNNGLNATLGGDGIFGYKRTGEQKEVASERMKEYFKNIDNREKASKSIKLYFESLESRDINALNQHAKYFNVYKVDGSFVGKYINQTEVAESLGINSQDVSHCLNKRHKTSKGYIFIHEDENQDLEIYLNKMLPKYYPPKNPKQFNVYDKDTNEYINTYDNQIECSLKLDINNTKISMCLNNKRKSTGGFKFYYIENDPNLPQSQIQ